MKTEKTPYQNRRCHITLETVCTYGHSVCRALSLYLPAHCLQLPVALTKSKLAPLYSKSARRGKQRGAYGKKRAHHITRRDIWLHLRFFLIVYSLVLSREFKDWHLQCTMCRLGSLFSFQLNKLECSKNNASSAGK